MQRISSVCLHILSITSHITVGVKSVVNIDCKEELNTQFVSILDFEVQLKLLQ
jgi:hypothetical protein